MSRGREFSKSSPGEIKFGFAVGQYHGPISEPAYRQEVVDHGLEDVVDDLLQAVVPEGFSWMQPVVDDQVLSGKINKPLRFMAVVKELERAQAEPERDLDYEKQVAALGQLLYDSCDENFNYLGFFVNAKDKDGNIHDYQWGRLELNPDTMNWQLPDELPVGEVIGVVPHALARSS